MYWLVYTVHMPQVTVYIREDDLEDWKAVEKKSEFIHIALRNTKAQFVTLKDYNEIVEKNEPEYIQPVKAESVRDVINDTIREGEKMLRETAFVPRPPDPDTGYPCCNKSKPCKHWHFLDSEGIWKNELTNKTREIV